MLTTIFKQYSIKIKLLNLMRTLR